MAWSDAGDARVRIECRWRVDRCFCGYMKLRSGMVDVNKCIGEMFVFWEVLWPVSIGSCNG